MRTKLTGVALAALVATFALGVASASAAVTPNPWLTNRFLNIAHQGGELEAPSNTMFAFKSALADRGADELEMDVNLSSDGQLMVIHNGTVDGTTDGTGAVSSLTAAQIQALDAGYYFQWRTGQYSHDPNREYPYRGVRTGAVPPPAGYSADDFRIPTLREVLNTFPTTPTNIEIKVPTPAGGIAIAEALAALLNEPAYRNRRDLAVVSFKQAPLARFHELAPQILLAPSEDALLQYALGQPLDPDPAVFEVPTHYTLGGSPLDVPDLLLNGKKAHENGYAVQVYLDGDEETDAVYKRLVDVGVDGIMSGAPGRLANYLCRADVKRPDGTKRCASQSDPPAPPASEPLDLDFSLNAGGLDSALRKGVVIRATCSVACKVKFQIQVSAKTAKRAGLGGKKGAKIVGQQTINVSATGSHQFRLKFNKGPKRALKTLNALPMKILAKPLSAPDASELGKTVKHSLTVKRPKK